jgi:multidrug resistance protein, MATE family
VSELKTMVRHAGTVLIGQLAVIAFGVADTVIAGRLSPQALATLSLASSIYISVYVGLNGLIQALLPVWAELRGADQLKAIGQSVRQALYMTGTAGLLGILALCYPEPWLRWTDVPQDLWPEVQAYLQVLALALVPSLLFRLYSTLNQSLGYPRLVTWLQAGALLIKIPLSAGLTFGLAGLPGLGVVGCAWATLVVNSLMLLTGIWLLRTQSIYQSFDLWQRLEPPHGPTLRHFARLGLPAGLSIMVEITSFTLMALFIARLGAVPLASHQIAANMAGVLYMIPLALGIASSARTGYWLGADQPKRARHAARTGLVLTAGMALLCACGLWLARAHVAWLFTDDPAVALAGAAWLTWVAGYHLADAVQTVCVFLLRCYRITLAPLLIYTVLLWGVGLYGGYLLAYHGQGHWAAQPSVATFWLTSLAALTMAAVLFLVLLWRAMPAQARRTQAI